MKTKEFIEKVKKLGFKIYKNNYCDGTKYFVLQNSFDVTMSHVAINKLFEMDIRFSEYMSETLVDLIVEYAKTPIEDREEKEKKYLLLHKYVLSKNLRLVNLAYNKYEGTYRLINLKFDNDIYKVLFTEEEIEKLKEKLDTNLEDFEINEVEE